MSAKTAEKRRRGSKERARSKERAPSKEKPQSKHGGGASSAGDSQNVKVAVRLRPFNKRELESHEKLIVSMEGNQTKIKDPTEKDEKEFAYDYSYWSFDGYRKGKGGCLEPDPSHPNGSKYADQKQVFRDLGEGVLANALEGYNSTLFAYGQTGSGKSFSVVGPQNDPGIVPIFAERLFEEIENRRGSADEQRIYEVTFSMIEIYNEVTRDLLNLKGGGKSGDAGLKIREHPKKGFYCEKLKVVPVDTFKAIQEKINEGTVNRTIRSTNMNETSSRAHTIVGITFTQKKKNSKGQEVSKSSIVNLVDLAGSERAERTKATGDRLKEGAAINLSLTSLGKCISALADSSSGGKKTKVPFRDSVLTKLLMNALGGNSRTVMIAAISPAAADYEESLSTLRYADRAKQIKTQAVINEDPTEALIRELQEENAKLKAMLEGRPKKVASKGDSAEAAEPQEEDEEIEEVQARIEENERQLADMQRSFEDRLEEAQTAATGQTQDELNDLKSRHPYLFNLNSDPMLSGMIVHLIRTASTLVGHPAEDNVPEIVLMGPSINTQHALIRTAGEHITVQALGGGSSKVVVNGYPIEEETELHHGDRVLFGTTQLYVFVNADEAAKMGVEAEVEVAYDDAMEEISRNSPNGERVQQTGEDSRLHQEITEILPVIEDANTISEKLDRMIKFEMVVVAPELLGLYGKQAEVYVRVRNFSNGLTYDWPGEKFMARFVGIQNMYEKFSNGEEWKVPDKEDPFTEPIDLRVRIGTVSVFLKSVAFYVHAKAQFEVTDIRGNEVGLLNVEVVPCNEKGEELGEDVWINNPNTLIGEDLHFAFRIQSARGIPPRFTSIQAVYRVFLDQNFSETKIVSDDSNPDFNYEKIFAFKPVTHDVLQYLMTGKVIVELWGVQVPIKRNLVADTHVLMEVESLNGQQGYRVMDLDKHKLKMEVDVLKKQSEITDEKMNYLREMVRAADVKGSSSLPTNQVQGVLDATTTEAVERWANVHNVPKKPNSARNAPKSQQKPPERRGSAPGKEPAKAGNSNSKTCVIC